MVRDSHHLKSVSFQQIEVWWQAGGRADARVWADGGTSQLLITVTDPQQSSLPLTALYAGYGLRPKAQEYERGPAIPHHRQQPANRHHIPVVKSPPAPIVDFLRLQYIRVK